MVQKTKFGDKKLTDKDTYQNYGPRMIQMRARAFCLRDGFSDILKGIRMTEEEEDQAFVGPAHVLEAAPRPEPPKITKPIEGEIVGDGATSGEEPNDYERMAGTLIMDLEATVNVEDLDELWDNSLPIYEDLPGDQRKIVLDRFDELRDGLSQPSQDAG